MHINILTIFKDMVQTVLGTSILARATANGTLSFEVIDIRDFSLDKHKKTDDYPFGGGAGLTMTAQPIFDAFAYVEQKYGKTLRVYMSPQGKVLDVSTTKRLSTHSAITLLCGHYEGVDQRVLDVCIDEEMSIGNYILTGGELPALVLCDAVARFVPGVIEQSAHEDESLYEGFLEAPQYTRPAVFRELPVPEVLLGGHHAKIAQWKRQQAVITTAKKRPELLQQATLTPEEQKIVQSIIEP